MYIAPHADRQVGIPESDANKITASEFNQITAELQNVITEGGLIPTSNDTTQLYEAVTNLIDLKFGEVSGSVTDLGFTFNNEGGIITSSTGADCLIPFASATTNGLFKKEMRFATDVISSDKAVYTEGHAGVLTNFGFDKSDAKAVLALTNYIKSTDTEAQYYPQSWNETFFDKKGRGQLMWLVGHCYLNQGDPITGASKPYNRILIDKSMITQYTVLSNGQITQDHIITTPTAHGFTNGQCITFWAETVSNLNEATGRGIPHSHGKQLFVEALSTTTLRLHTSATFLSTTPRKEGTGTPLIWTSSNWASINPKLNIDAWDWHGHFSIEPSHDDGRLHTFAALSFNHDTPTLRFNNGVIHFASGTQVQFTGERGTNRDVLFGYDHNCPEWGLRTNSAEHMDLIWFNNGFTPNVGMRMFTDTGKIQVGGGDLQLDGMFNTRQTSTTVPNTTNALIKQSNGTYTQSGTTTITINHTNPHNFITGQRLAFQFTTGGAVDLFNGFYNITVVDANNYTIVAPSSLTTSGSVRAINMTAEHTWLEDVITTNATQTTLKAIPFAVGEMIMMDGWIEAKRLGSTDANTTGALFKFTAMARRTASLGTELVGTPVITMPQGTISGVTSGSVVIDAITGNFNIKVTGVASQNIQWKAKINTSRL